MFCELLGKKAPSSVVKNITAFFSGFTGDVMIE